MVMAGGEPQSSPRAGNFHPQILSLPEAGLARNNPWPSSLNYRKPPKDALLLEGIYGATCPKASPA